MEPLKSMLKYLKSKDDFAVVCHYDADGLTAGAIASLMLERLGKKKRIQPTRQLDEERLGILKDLGENYLFVDLGSGQIPLIEKNFSSYGIIDHHETLSQTDKPHFNAHLVGWDGAKEISGSGCTYLVAKALDPKNIDLSPIALVGAVGDMQDSTGALVGKNRDILADGIKAGLIESRKDISLYGRHSRPLAQFLSFSSEPFFPGLTGDEEACELFLSKLGIPVRKGDELVYYADLLPSQKKKLVSALYVVGKRNFIPDFILKLLVREVYELKNEQPKTPLKDSREFATLLNACGRHERGDIGLKVCMGDRDDALHKAELLLKKHRRMLRAGLEYAKNTGLDEMEHCFVLDAGHHIQDTLVGVIAGMLYGAKVADQNKPIVGLAFDDKGMLKASGRANWMLVRKGLHLGKALKAACEPIGGEGGGHSIAAGARFDPSKKEEFLELFDKIVGEQLA
ncbi:DHH family phosphoesterase [archaeon]|nr:DHH family phosphoesterase [archaeon]